MKSQSFNATQSKAIKAVKSALENLELDLKELDEKSGMVKASYSGSFLSWGNSVDYKTRFSEANFFTLYSIYLAKKSCRNRVKTFTL